VFGVLGVFGGVGSECGGKDSQEPGNWSGKVAARKMSYGGVIVRLTSKITRLSVNSHES